MSETYEYQDGNGNRYIIKSELMEYIPVKPSQSSTGFYDGGEYFKTEISKLQYEEIISVFSEAIQNKSCHIKNRVKGSGRIIVNERKGIKIYIISPNSEELDKIEKTLHSF